VFVVHNRIEVPAEGADAFERAFTESMRTTLAGVPGLRRSLLMRPAGPNAPYVSTLEDPSAIELFTVVEDVTA
jgi:heme oxygenase (mycobilin-producing)